MLQGEYTRVVVEKFKTVSLLDEIPFETKNQTAEAVRLIK